MYVIGDSHGLGSLLDALKRSKLTGQSFIHVGDVSIGFVRAEIDILMLDRITKHLESTNSYLYLLRGNHDNPQWWTDSWYQSDRIKLVQDYEVLEIEDRKILCIGGAISIDRLVRTPQIDYWPEEEIVKQSVTTYRDLQGVITHNVPLFCPPFGINSTVKYYIDLEKSLGNQFFESQLLGERKYLSDVFEELQKNNDLKFWCSGHMHKDDFQEYKGVDFHMLGINSIKEIR